VITIDEALTATVKPVGVYYSLGIWVPEPDHIFASFETYNITAAQLEALRAKYPSKFEPVMITLNNPSYRDYCMEHGYWYLTNATAGFTPLHLTFAQEAA